MMVAFTLASAGVTSADDDITPWHDVFCSGGTLLPGGCIGTSSGCGRVQVNELDDVEGVDANDCSQSGAKCRWSNGWEAELVSGYEDESAVVALIEGSHNAASDDWSVEGVIGCANNPGDDQTCEVSTAPDACRVGSQNFKSNGGDLKCDTVTFGVGIPQGVWVEITCTDPVHPCAFVKNRVVGAPEGVEPVRETTIGVCE